jgi:Zn/Cd-binding protein ZinT
MIDIWMGCHESAVDEKETREIIEDYFHNFTVKNRVLELWEGDNYADKYGVICNTRVY